MADSDPNGDGDTSDAESTFYQYDLYGNLLRVDLPDGRAIEYDVDGAGRRVGRRELDADGNEISFRGWIYRDLLRPIAEVNALGDVVARYVYFDGYPSDQNGGRQLKARLGGGGRGFEHSPNNVPDVVLVYDAAGGLAGRFKVVANRVGTPLFLVEFESAQVAQRIERDEFGRELVGVPSPLLPLGFVGGLHDADTLLTRMGARDYDASIGRWLAREPFGGLRKRALGHYLYARQDPINFRDISGFDEDDSDWWDDFTDVVRDVVDFFGDLLGGAAEQASDGAGAVNDVADLAECGEAERALKLKKERCKAACAKCWNESSEDTVAGCMEYYDETGSHPSNPSDDWFKCWKNSKEWNDFAKACGTRNWM